MLTPKQNQAIVGLLSGKTIKDTATICKVKERTLYRWLEQEEFTSELKSREHEVIDAVSWRLTSLSRLACDVYKLILETECFQPGMNVKRLAASDILGILLKYREICDIEPRLQALEQKLRK